MARGAQGWTRWSRAAGWWVLSLAAILQLYVSGTIAHRALEMRRGDRSPLPAVLRLFNDAAHRAGPGADFFALYHAGVALERDGRIYAWGNDDVTPPYYLYRYLPGFAQTGGRLVRLVDPWTAYLGWLVLLEATLLCCLFLTSALFRAHAPGLVPWLCALWLVYTPLWLELYMGQFSFVTAALLLLCGAVAVSPRPRLALAPWIAGVGLKIYPAILLPLWWRKRWLLPAAGLLAALAVANLPGFVDLPGAWRAFIASNLSPPGRLQPDAGNYGLAYLLQLGSVRGLGIPEKAWPWFHRALGALTLGTAVLLVARRREPPVLPSIVLLILAHQLSYKHVWEHHYVTVLPMGLLLLRHHLGDHRHSLLILAALLVLALPSPFVFWDRPGGDPGVAWPFLVQLFVPATKILPTLALFALAARSLLATSPTDASEPSLPAGQPPVWQPAGAATAGSSQGKRGRGPARMKGSR